MNLYQQYTERFTRTVEGRPVINCSQGAAILMVAAEWAAQGLGSRDDALRHLGDAGLLAEYARRIKESTENLNALHQVAKNGMKHEPMGEYLPDVIMYMMIMNQRAFDLVRRRWSDAAAKEAGL